MSSLDRESFKYLQIDRPVLAGGDRFLTAVRDIGQRILGGEVVTAPSYLHLEDDEFLTTTRPLEEPKLDVYAPHDLKLVLLRRVASNVMGSRYNFNHQAAELTARRKAGQTSSKTVRRPGKSAEDILNDIALQAGERPDQGRLRCASVVPGFDSILGSFLALVPENGLVAGRQASEAFEQLEALNPRVAHGANPSVPVVPFASYPEGISVPDYNRLVEEIQGLDAMPVTLTLGAVNIYSNSSVPRNINVLADD